MMNSKLQDWVRGNEPGERMLYKDGFWGQIGFVRDTLPRGIATSGDEFLSIRDSLMVISTHTSKSVCLPVYQFTLPNGTVVTMRCNFHDWKVSVNSPHNVEVNFADLFNPNIKISDCYCEGFPRELVYGSYGENRQRFTVELDTNYEVYTFLWLLTRSR